MAAIFLSRHYLLFIIFQLIHTLFQILHMSINIYTLYISITSIMESQIIIRNPTQISKLIRRLCQKPLRCKKQGDLGLTSNQRIIYVKQGYFEYYKVFEGYLQGQPSSLKEKQKKATVKLQDILEVEYLPLISKKTLCLTIPSNKIKDTRQQTSSSSSLAKWKFTFDFELSKYLIQPEKPPQNTLPQIQPQRQTTQLQPELLDKYIGEMRRQKAIIAVQLKLQKEKEITEKMKSKYRSNKNVKLYVDSSDDENNFMLDNFWVEYFSAIADVIKESNNKSKTISKIVTAEVELLAVINKFKQASTNLFKDYVNEKMVGWREQSLNLNGFKFFKGVWIKIGGKSINQEFMVNMCISDILLRLKHQNKDNLRCPLMNLCEYKTFKGLVMMDFPLLKQSEKYKVYEVNLSSNYNTPEEKRIISHLEKISQIMGLKQQTIIKENKKIKAPLGREVRVLQFVAKKHKQQSFKNLDHNLLYVYGVGNILPVDYNFLPGGECWLRAELVGVYRDKLEETVEEEGCGECYLLSEAFRVSEGGEYMKEQEDFKVARAANYLSKVRVKELVGKLVGLQTVLLDSESVTKLFHEFGVNIRYLAKVKEEVSLPYVVEMLTVEAAARSIKKIYRGYIRDYLWGSKDSTKYYQQGTPEFRRQLLTKDQKPRKHQHLHHLEEQLPNQAIDFLNLVFGNSSETHHFWEVVSHHSTVHFGVPCPYPPPFKPGCLLHAVLWHCGFALEFSLDVPLFQAQEPFRLADWRYFRTTSKSFHYPSLDTYRLINNLPIIAKLEKEELSKEVGFNLLKLELIMQVHGGQDIQTTLSIMNSYKEYIGKPTRTVPFHPIEIPFYIVNKSEANFHHALEIAKFALPDNHPIYISLYYQYSVGSSEAELLRKSCLLSAIRSLGEFHPKTTEIYSKFYKQGQNEFEYKALRESNLQKCEQNCRRMYQKLKYQSCVKYCQQQVLSRDMQLINSMTQLQSYFKLLEYGIRSANKTSNFAVGLTFSNAFSQAIRVFNIKQLSWHQLVLKQTLLIMLSLNHNKYYLYKMVLLVLHIQQKQQPQYPKDQRQMRLPSIPKQKQMILKGIMQVYYIQQTHLKWLNSILKKILQGLMYFNYLPNLFTEYKYHLDNYNDVQFKQALGYLHLLVKLFGQSFFQQNLYQIGQIATLDKVFH